MDFSSSIADADLNLSPGTSLDSTLPDINMSNNMNKGKQSSSQVLTYEPYEPSSQNRRNKNKPRYQEYPQQRLSNHEQSSPRYYTIRTTTGSNLSEIDTIRANEDLEKCIGGKPKRISELRSGSLLIEVANAAQGGAIQNLKKMAECPVVVELDDKLNQCKGTIYYQNKPKYTEEQLLQHLKQFNVTELYQIKTFKNNVKQNSPIYILTFKGYKPPESVQIGWVNCRVRIYIPRPRRCFKCQGYGHGARTCRSDDTICVRCGESAPHEQPCTSSPKCVNCNMAHPASSTNCSYYKFEAEVLHLQATERTSYLEAKRTVKQRYPRTGTSYASAASKRNLRNANENSSQQSPQEQSQFTRPLTVATPILAQKSIQPTCNPSTSTTPTTSQSNNLNISQKMQTPIPQPDTSGRSRKRSASSTERKQTKRAAEEPAEGFSVARGRGKSLLKDYPMPPNMPTSYPGQPPSTIPVVGAGRYEPLAQMTDTNNNTTKVNTSTKR